MSIKDGEQMTNLGNRDIFAKNLTRYIERSGKTQKEIAEVIGVAASTFNNWVMGHKYPRIDKIEMLANYFGILKSDLIEDKSEMQKNNEVIANIIVRLRADSDFLSLVSSLERMDAAQVRSVEQMLNALLK